jgi:hypothetical protein
MKTIAIPMILMALSGSSMASINKKKYDREISEIARLEKDQNFRKGIIIAASLANSIAREAHFDEMITSIGATLTTKENEVVTNGESTQAGFNFFGLISGKFSEGYDVAEIVISNPEEVEAFNSIKAGNLLKLQRNLKSYLTKNETSLFYSKLFATKALQLALKIPFEETTDIQNVLLKTVQRVSMVSFLGVQNIMNCTQTDYANRTSGWGLNIKGFIAFGLSDQEKQYAHQVKSCQSSTENASMVEAMLNSADLMLIDQTLSTSRKKLEMKMIMESEAPAYPSWDLSYVSPHLK